MRLRFFIEHLQESFRPGWTFENYGRAWQIHHLKPCSQFDWSRDKAAPYLAFQWLNLHPVDPIENAARGDALHDDDMRQLARNIKKARAIGLVGRLPRRQVTRVWVWQEWLTGLPSCRSVRPAPIDRLLVPF